MPSVDERIVSIHFENAKFEANIAQTIASLMKLNEALKLVGAVNGLQSIEAASKNVKLATAATSADNLKRKTDFTQNAKSIADLEGASNKVKLTSAQSAADQTTSRFGKLGELANRAVAGLNGVVSRGDKANQALQLHGVDGRFQAIEASSRSVKLSGITTAVAGAQKSFSVLQGAASVALGGIAAQAAIRGAQAAKSFTTPITQGFSEYETNIDSVQTILSNTEGQQGAGLKGVNAALDQLNHYADKTKYSFSEMAKNVGTFTAAGVELKTAVPAIKGIANLAAVSGSSSQQASTAMYQLSQSLASGKVSLQDWNSVVNAGMGGRKFQEAIVKQSQAMGTLTGKVEGLGDPTRKLTINGKSFRESIMSKPGEKTFFTSEVLSNTLKNLSGDMSKAQIMAQGFNSEQADAIIKQGKLGLEAATQIKTFSALMDTTKEAIGSGWSTTFKLILGDFGQAKKLFTAVGATVTTIVGNMAKSRNDLLKGWQALGGRDDLFAGIKQSFLAVSAAFGAVKAGFREIFPKSTSQDLANASNNFKQFATNLNTQIAARLPLIKSLMAGFFATFSIGFQIVKRVIGVITGLGSALGGATGGGFKTVALAVSGFVVALDKALKSGASFREIVATFPGPIKALLAPLVLVREAFGKLFSKLKGDPVSGQFDAIKGKSDLFAQAMDKAKAAWASFTDAIAKRFQKLKPAFDGIKQQFAMMGDNIANALNNADWGNVFQAINTGLLGGILLTIKKFLSGGIFGKSGAGLMSSISESFDVLTGSLKAMQRNVQSKTLLNIAIALGILTLSIVALSTVDAEGLDRSMSALVLAFTQLVGAMFVLTKLSGVGGFAKMPVIAASLILIATALRILVSSVKALAELSYDELKRGLAGTAILMGTLAAAVLPLSAGGLKLPFVGAGLILVATGLRILVGAVKSFGEMDGEQLKKGLIGIAAGLGIVTAAVYLIPPTLPLYAYGLITFAVALGIMQKAIQSFGKMPWDELERGLAGMAGGLLVLAVTLRLMPNPLQLAGQATGLLILSFAIGNITKALATLAKLSVNQILQSIGGLAATLVLLAAAMFIMQDAIGGAAVLYVAAKGLQALVPVITTLGAMSLGDLGKGLGAIAAGLAVLAVGAVLLEPGIITLLALGAAIVLVGVGVGAAATGLAALTNAFTGFIEAVKGLGSDSGQSISQAVTAVITAVTQLAQEIPKAIGTFIAGIGKMIVSLAASVPAFVEGVTHLLTALLDVIILTAPKIGQAFLIIVQTALRVLRAALPDLLNTGILLLKALLDGINRNLTAVVTMAGNIVIKLLNALAVKLPGIIQAGANFVIALLNGISNNAPRVIPAAVRVVTTFLTALTKEIPKLVPAAAKLVVTFLNEIARHVADVVKAGYNLIGHVITGIGQGATKIVNAAADTIIKFLDAAAKKMVQSADRIAKIITAFVNGMAEAVRTNAPEMRAAGANLADALVDGAVDTLKAGAKRIVDAATSPFRLAIKAANKLNKIKSPSRVYMEMGKYIMDGAEAGLLQNGHKPVNAVTDMAYGMINTVKKVMKINSPSVVMTELGKMVSDGLSKGISKGEPAVAENAQTLIDTLKDKMAAFRTTIASETAKIEKLSGVNNKTAAQKKALKDAKQARTDARTSLKDVDQGRDSLADNLKKEKPAIAALTAKYAELTDQLKEATDTYEGLIDAQKQYITETTEKYATLPDIVGSTTKSLEAGLNLTIKAADENGPANFENPFTKQIDAINKYKATLDKLRGAGLNDTVYKQLLDMGVEGQKAAELILTSGVASTNAMSDQLVAAKGTLTAAATALTEVPVTLDSYLATIQAQITATDKYSQTLATLHKMGLDDTTYRKLVEQGTAGQQFADQLQAGGDAAIKRINALDVGLTASAKKLAANAGSVLLDKGIADAKAYMDGLNNGLNNEKGLKQIKASLVQIANDMTAAFRKAMKIKSPSRVMAELGKFTALGLAAGMDENGIQVSRSAANLGDTAVTAMQRSLTDITDAVSGVINVDPTITPVLDLTNVEAGAKQIGDLTNVVPITAAASYGQAASISAQQLAMQQAVVEAAAVAQAPSLTFEQTINSPDPVSPTEVYRLTKNTLSQAKAALGM